MRKDMRKKLLFTKTIKEIAFLLLLALMFVSCKNVKSGSGYNVPKIVDDTNSPSGKTTTWQCVYFGSFPQIEILDDDLKISVDDYAVDNGVIRDKETYDAIIKQVEKDGNISEDTDIIYNGDKYRVESDDNYKDYYGANFVGQTNKEQYYKYKSNDVKYRVFKYQPIIWRIVDVNDNTLTLISNKILMSMKYGFETNANWENSFVRKYLNSYETNDIEQEFIQSNKTPKVKKGFLNIAFTEEEKNVIIKSKIKNKNNDYYDMVSSGNDTEDYIYLPSNEEVFSTDTAMKYGFHEGSRVDDPSKRFRSTMYAKYMGAWWSPVDNYKGNSFWFMRTNGYSESFVTYICDFGYIYDRGTSIAQKGAGILPMMKIDASKIDLKDAGVVCSDEVNKSTYKLLKSEGGVKKPNAKNDYVLINFGIYPNREIINNEILHDKDFNLLEGDYIVDDELYNKLENGEWKSNDTCSTISIGNDKYLRERRGEYHGIKNENVATIVRDDEFADKYFHYGYTGKEYHYFKIEPIVWRVLEDVDGIKTLITDKVIDNVQFSTDLDESCYDNSKIRYWLNADKNFFSLESFSNEEKELILDYKLDKDKMKNNYYFGTKSTSDEFDKRILNKETIDSEVESDETQVHDKFYLLSEEELFYGEKAKVYGFADSDAIADVNRRFLSTAYAKFKGIWFSDKEETKGNCFYMTRTTGYDQSDVVYVDENGAIYNRGINVKTDDIGLLPVVNIKSD